MRTLHHVGGGVGQEFFRPGQSKYWVTAVPLRNPDRACLEIAADVESNFSIPRSVRARHCGNLFGLCREWLPDVRGNYFWPELHREIERRCRAARTFCPPQSALTAFLRTCLDAVFTTELSRLRKEGGHHCYLELIFSHAGVGKDRNTIIRDYLRFLADHVKDRQTTPIEDARTGLTEYIATLQERRRDALPLRNVLLQIGAQVLTLVRALHEHTDRRRLIFGSWEELRDLWLGLSGSDLDAMTPAASAAIHDFVPQLSGIWTRAEIFRHTRDGEMECTWPNGSTASDLREVKAIPLGSATLTHHAIRIAITVIERSDISLEEMLTAKQDVWHALPDGYEYRVSQSAFQVGASGTRDSVPLFYPGAKRVGSDLFFWGGMRHSVRRVADAAKYSSAQALHLRTVWIWQREALFFEIDRIRTTLPDGEGYVLRLGERELWRGSIAAGRPESIRRLKLHIDRLPQDAEPLVVLEQESTNITCATLLNVWPTNASSFLAVNRRIYQSDRIVHIHASTPEDCKICLISRNLATPPDLEGLREISRERLNLGAVEQTKINLRAEAWRGSVGLEGSSWSIEISPAIALTYPPDSEVEKGGIRYTGSGNISVVSAIGDVRLSATVSPPLDGIFGFWITKDDQVLFCPLTSDYVSALNNSFDLKAGELIRDRIPGSAQGYLSIRVGTALDKEGLQYNFYVPPDEPDTPTIALGERCVLQTDLPGATVSSDQILSQTILGRRVQGILTSDDWEVSARWIPRIFDLTLGEAMGSRENHTFDMLTLVCDQPLIATVFMEQGVTGLLVCAGTSYEVRAGERINLSEPTWAALLSNDSVDVRLSGDCGESPVVWRVVATPSVVTMTAEFASELGEMRRIRVASNGRAARDTKLGAVLKSGEQVIAEQNIMVHPDPNFRWEASLDLRTNEVAIDVPLSVTLHLEGNTFGTFELPTATAHRSIPLGSQAFIANLRKLIDEYRDSVDTRYLTEFFFLIFDESLRKGEVPAAAFRVGQTLGSSNPRQEQALVASIDCLDALLRGSSVAKSQNPLSETVAMSIILDSVWLLLTKIHLAKGIFDPPSFEVVRARVAHSLGQPPCQDRRTRGLAELALFSALGALKEMGRETMDIPPLRDDHALIFEACLTANLPSIKRTH